MSGELIIPGLPTEATALTGEERTMVDQAGALARAMLPIQTDADAVEAGAVREEIYTFYKLLEERRQAFKKPITAAGRQIDAAFKAPLDALDGALATVKATLTAWTIQVERRRREAEEAARQAAPADAVVAPITPAIMAAQSSASLVQTREFREVVVVDAAALPRKYLVPHFPNIRADALNGVAIPGVEVRTTRRATN